MRIESDMTEVAVGKDRLFTPAVIILVFLSFVMGISEFSIIGILPDISEGLDVSYTVIGSLVSIFALSYAFLAPTISGVCARFGRRRLFFAMAALFVASDIWTLLSTSYVSIAGSRILTAASSGALLSVGITYTMDIVSPRYRASAVSWIFSGFSIASVFGMPLGNTMSHLLGWRSVFVLILVLGIISIVAAARILPKDDPEPPVRRRGSSGRMLRDPRILLGMAITMFGGGGVYVMYTYITPILEDELGIDPTMVPMALMVIGSCMLVSNLMSGRIAAGNGIGTLRITFLIESGLLVLLPMALGSFVTGMADLMLIGLMFYLMNSPVQMHMIEIAQRDYPESLILASSLNPSSFNVGIMLGSLLGGVIYDSAGAASLGYGSGAMVLLASVSAVVLYGIRRRRGIDTDIS